MGVKLLSHPGVGKSGITTEELWDSDVSEYDNMMAHIPHKLCYEMYRFLVHSTCTCH